MKKILLICILIAGIAFVGLVVFKLSLQSFLFYGLVAACPLMHVFMKGSGKHNH